MKKIKSEITEIQRKSTDDVVKELAKTTLALAVQVVPGDEKGAGPGFCEEYGTYVLIFSLIGGAVVVLLVGAVVVYIFVFSEEDEEFDEESEDEESTDEESQEEADEE